MDNEQHRVYEDFAAPGAKPFSDYSPDERRIILNRAVNSKNFSALERIRQHYHNHDHREHAEELFTKDVLFYAAISCSTIILDWLYDKYPNVHLWAGEGVWQSLMPHNPCGVWLCKHASVQELALLSVDYFILDYYVIIPHMQGLCRTPELEAAILKIAMELRKHKVVAAIAANNGNLFVRNLCVANHGEMLRFVGENKWMARVLLRAGVSRSDYASVGLDWQLA
ncbi:MAG: hypothetical protein EBU92_12440 [Betaproteobacteria bacterium]|nr:hypothetical protein [Betaproteobacteria bacterium]